MDSVREIVASSTFELGTTGIPNKGSQNVSITSIADLGKGKIAFAGYTRGYLRNKNFQGFSPDFASFSGKKFVGMLENKDQIKFVICDKTDYEWSVDYIQKHKLDEKCKILFSPSYDEMSPTELADLILSDGLNVRLQIQLHKVLWGNERGK